MGFAYYHCNGTCRLRQNHIGAADDILFLDPCFENATSAIGDVYRRIDAGMRDLDVIVVRSSTLTTTELGALVENDTILQRILDQKSILCLAPRDHARDGLELRHLPSSRAAQSPPSMDELRAIETEAWLRQRGAIYDDANFHFALPRSGVHAKEFIRVGDALTSIIATNRLTDWLMPFVPESGFLLADTGAMLPLLQSVLLRRYRRALSLRTAGEWRDKLTIGVLPSYPQNREDVVAFFQTINHPSLIMMTNESDATLGSLFVCSVTASGRLTDLVSEVNRSLVGAPLSSVVICDTAESPSSTSVVFFRQPVKKWQVGEDGECDECRNGMRLVVIDPMSYERAPRAYSKPATIGKLEATLECQEFWAAVDRTKAVQFHVNVPYLLQEKNDYRHFPVYIDVVKLLEDAAFRFTVSRRLKELPEPDMVLIPKHGTSVSVQALAKECFPAASHYVIAPSATGLAPLADLLARSEKILVLDDALVTGRTLVSLRAAIYEVARRYGKNPITYPFVLLARPDTADLEKMVARPYFNVDHADLVPGLTLSSVPYGYHAYLPFARCSWCDERQLLLAALRAHRDAPNDESTITAIDEQSLAWIDDRIRRLDASPPESELLPDWTVDAELLKVVRSIFGDLSFGPAMGAGMSACVAKTHLLGRLSGDRDTVDVQQVFSSYYDAVVVSAIFRACDRTLLRDPRIDATIAKALRLRQATDLPAALAAELAYYAASSRLAPGVVLDYLASVTHQSVNAWRQVAALIKSV